MTPDRIEEPYLVDDQRSLVGELMLGKWAIYAHEWLPGNADLDTWTATLERLCAAAGVPVEIVTDRRKDMTIAWNRELPPTPEQIHVSVQAIKYYRFTGHTIRPEKVAKPTRPDPYARYRPHR